LKGGISLNINELRGPKSTDYIERKFKSFNRWFTSDKTRKKKCIAYYNAADGDPTIQSVITSQYSLIFQAPFPKAEAEATANRKFKSANMMESSQYFEGQQDRAASIGQKVAMMQVWQKSNEWQAGDSFFRKLKQEMMEIDSQVCDSTQFNTEFAATCKREITTGITTTDQERSAKFEMMVGFKQKTECVFAAHDENWGDINAKLEQSFQAGIWANGTAGVKMTQLGLSAQAQAAVAIGAQLIVKGDLSWTKKQNALKLTGEVEVFVGAKAQASIKLSASAILGLDAQIKAGAFAGFSATAKGLCSYSYDGQDVISVAAEASIQFGVGAAFEAGIKAPIFGPTVVSFKAGLAVGLGSSVKTTASVDFDAAALAANQNFRKVVYWRTLSQGWDPTLYNQDAKNLYYLKKCIDRLQHEQVQVTEIVSTYHETPSELRSLLRCVD
jgi:hypothetical protein